MEVRPEKKWVPVGKPQQSDKGRIRQVVRGIRKGAFS